MTLTQHLSVRMVNMETSPSNKNQSPNNKKHKGRTGKERGSKFYCSTCNVHCPNETTLQQHNSGKKHVGNVANVQRRDKHALSSIFVGNLPKLAQIRAKMTEETGSFVEGTENDKLKSDLTTVFGSYGEIVKIIIDKKHGSYCIIEYKTPGMAQVALSEYQAGKVQTFYGKKLQIKSRTVTEIKPLRQIRTESELDKDNIVALLEEADDDPVCALNMVDAAISVSDKVRRQHQEACTRLQTQLNDNFPFYQVVLNLYGSAATGLALRDSDLDISLTVGKEKRLDRDDLIRVLKEKCTGVSHVHVIPAPGQGTITRFLDGISNTTFDILFNNRLGVANTALIKTVLSYDVRIARFIRLVVYWRRVVLGARFPKQCTPSSYSITIMCLHFLQHKGFLPDFFQTSLITEHKMIYDLDCSFITDISKLPPPTQDLNIPELLAGFWSYYGAEFNVETQVVSMRGVLNKSEVEETSKDTQHHYVTLFKPSPIAVQDPFVPTHNLTHNVSLECVVFFRDVCRSATSNWSKGAPLYTWMLSGISGNSAGISGDNSSLQGDGSSIQGDGSSIQGDNNVSMETEGEEDGDKTPVWGEESVSVGNKRSVEEMEH